MNLSLERQPKQNHLGNFLGLCHPAHGYFDHSTLHGFVSFDALQTLAELNLLTVFAT